METERLDMEEIRILSTCTVRPTTAAHNSDSLQIIELTPWDLRLLQVGPIQKGLLFIINSPQENESSSPEKTTLIDHLKTSLSHTLDFFPPLAGRLAATRNPDDTTSFFIDCNAAGAQFTHATVSGLTVADILKPMYVPPLVHSFFPLNGVLNHEGVTKPLLAVQVTELLDGFFIGCTMNHSVVDGTSFWHFFNSWAEISRGLDCISKPPVLKRWFAEDIKPPIRIPLNDDQKFIDDFIHPPFVQERVFHFTKEKIAKLKAKANAEMGTNRISSLQALLAHTWLSVIRLSNVDANKVIRFRLPVSARSRLRPPLGEGYFGNAVHSWPISTTAGQLLQRGLGWAALQMNEKVALHTHEEVRNFYENWVKNPKLVKMGDLLGNAMITSSSPRFSVYGNDFGWGKPVAVRSGPANKSHGKLTVFPGTEEGSVDIELCLLPETFHAMSDDAEFMEAITI